MKVLILGATGFIGNPAAKAFVAAGHQVYGQTRSSSSANTLLIDEITPVIGDTSSLSAWLGKTVVELKIDVVVDCMGGMDIGKLAPEAFEIVSEAVKESRPYGPALTYIYCSGTWVHGENRTDIVSDLSPVDPSTGVPLTAWRIPLERSITSSPHLHGIVLRPSLLYGRSASLLTPVLRSAVEGMVEFPGTEGGGGRLMMVHQDDLANAFVLAAEKAPIAKGLVFDITESVSVSTDDFLSTLVRISGAKGYTYTSTEHPYMFALGSTQLIRPHLARSLLGWQPTRMPFITNAPVYFAAWKAAQGL